MNQKPSEDAPTGLGKKVVDHERVMGSDMKFGSTDHPPEICKTDPVGMPLGGPSFGGDEVPTDTVQPQGFTLDSEKYPEEPAADNWAHRSKNMKCIACMWFVEKATISSPTPFGRCRKHSPTLSGWPAVYGSDWCGDHKLDEEKL